MQRFFPHLFPYILFTWAGRCLPVTCAYLAGFSNQYVLGRGQSLMRGDGGERVREKRRRERERKAVERHWRRLLTMAPAPSRPLFLPTFLLHISSPLSHTWTSSSVTNNHIRMYVRCVTACRHAADKNNQLGMELMLSVKAGIAITCHFYRCRLLYRHFALALHYNCRSICNILSKNYCFSV